MSITYGFYNSVNHDRKYNATQMSNLFEGIINDGVFASIGTSMVVQAGSGMVVNVGEGRAWFNKTWTNNDAAYPITISEAELTLNRIDTIVLEVNTSTRINAFKVIKGTPGITPSAPDLTNSDTQHQHPLAQIYVGASVTEILQANITNFVGTEECPFITGIIQTITTEGITALFEAEWDAWFTSIQNQLSGDVAGNLQLQINEKVDIANKATEEEVTAGTNDDHWMTPAKTQNAFTGKKATTDQAETGLDDSHWMSPAKTVSAVNSLKATDTDVTDGTNDTHWMTPAKTVDAMNKSIKIGDKISQISKLTSGRFVPCNGGLLPESLRTALRGFASAHDFQPFNGYGNQSSPRTTSSTAYNNVGMAANDSIFVVAAGAAAQRWTLPSTTAPQSTDSFSIFSSPNPETDPFSVQVTCMGETLLGIGYDIQTSQFWVASISSSTSYFRVRYSSDGTSWILVSSSSVSSGSYYTGLLNGKANNGRLIFAQRGLAGAGMVFDLSTHQFTTFAWPITANANQGQFYVSKDGLHMAFYYNNIVYTTANGGTSWASTTTFINFTSICYSDTCGWLAQVSQNIYHASEGGGTWTSVTTLSGFYAYFYAFESGRVYIYDAPSSSANPPVIHMTDNGTTWTVVTFGSMFYMRYPSVGNSFVDYRPLLKEIDGKLLFGCTTGFADGNLVFGLLDGITVKNTASINMGYGFSASVLKAMCFTYDPTSQIIHLLLGNTSQYDTVGAGSQYCAFLDIQVKDDVIILERSSKDEKYRFPAYDIPYFGTSPTGSLFSPVYPQTTDVGGYYNDNTSSIENNSAMAINFKGEWKAYSSTISGDTTTGKYVIFYIVGSSLATKMLPGQFLCIEEG